MAEWIEPKTDWVADDYVRVADYRRIVGNLNYLKEQADIVFKTMQYENMNAKVTYSDIPYADMINAIENNLEKLNLSTFQFSIGETMNYSANDRFINYMELNRIESAMLRIEKGLEGILNFLPHVAIRLGRDEAFRRVKYARNEPVAYRLKLSLGRQKGIKL